MADLSAGLIKNEKLRKNNLGLFRERYGEDITIDPDEDEKFRAEEAKDGEIVLYIKNALPNGRDLRLNSLYDPAYEAKRWAKKQEMINRRTAIALMGFSTGVYLKALMMELRPDTAFFVYEPLEGLFAFLCAFADLSDIIVNTRVRLAVTDKQHSLMSDEMIHELATFRPEAKGIITPFYSSNEAFDKICSELEIMMVSTRNYQSNRGRNALRCRMYAWNHMRNAYLLADLRKRIPEGMPAIIVSAGPSLRGNVEVLKQIKGHAFILCTDRALAVLDEHGIIPDAIVSLDAEKSADYMKADVAEGVPVICSYQLNIDTQKLYYDRRIFYHALSYEYEIIGEKVEAQNGLDQGGNVAGGAFTVCEFLGIKTVVLIGQDLAFINGQHHADSKSDGAPTDLDVCEIKGIDGNMVLSNSMWIGFRNFFERQISLHPEMRVIDATEGGALIEGTEIMTLKGVADTICVNDYDMDSVIKDLPYAENEEEYLKTVEVQEKWIKDLDMIAENSRELVGICNRLLKTCKYNDINDRKAHNTINKMDKLREQIYDTRVYSVMEEFWFEDLYSIPDYTFMIRNNEEAIPVFENAIAFYEKCPEDCESLKQELKAAIELGKADFENEKSNS